MTWFIIVSAVLWGTAFCWAILMIVDVNDLHMRVKKLEGKE